MDTTTAVLQDELIDGWSRSSVDPIDMRGTRTAGDYAMGTGYEVRYRKVLADGTVLVVDDLYYVEHVDISDAEDEDEPIDWARVGPVNRMRFARYADAAAEEAGEAEWEDYTYDHVGYLIRSSLAEYEAEALEGVSQDYRGWALTWDGEPIRR